MPENPSAETRVFMCRPHLDPAAPLPPLPAGYSLEALGPEHDSALASLLSAAFGEPWDLARVRNSLSAADDVRAVYGVLQDGRLVACAASQVRPHIAAGAGFVHWLATHPDARRRGYAARLVVRLLEDFHSRADHCAWLVTQAERRAAIELYLRLGFVPEYSPDPENQQRVWSAFFERRV